MGRSGPHSSGSPGLPAGRPRRRAVTHRRSPRRRDPLGHPIGSGTLSGRLCWLQVDDDNYAAGQLTEPPGRRRSPGPGTSRPCRCAVRTTRMWAGVNGLSQTMTSACPGSGRHTGIPSSPRLRARNRPGHHPGGPAAVAAASKAFPRKRRSAMRVSGIRRGRWRDYGHCDCRGRGRPRLDRDVLAFRDERLVLLPALQPFPACRQGADSGGGHEGDDLGLIQVGSWHCLRHQSGEPPGCDREDRSEDGDEPADRRRFGR